MHNGVNISSSLLNIFPPVILGDSTLERFQILFRSWIFTLNHGKIPSLYFPEKIHVLICMEFHLPKTLRVPLKKKFCAIGQGFFHEVVPLVLKGSELWKLKWWRLSC